MPLTKTDILDLRDHHRYASEAIAELDGSNFPFHWGMTTQTAMREMHQAMPELLDAYDNQEATKRELILRAIPALD